MNLTPLVPLPEVQGLYYREMPEAGNLKFQIGYRSHPVVHIEASANHKGMNERVEIFTVVAYGATLEAAQAKLN